MNDIRIQSKKILRTFILIVSIIVFTLIVMLVMNKYKYINKEYYTANDFNIKTIYSSIDYDKDSLDDYSDFVLGARKDHNNNPEYISEYYEGGYPPDDKGVCTDVVWRAFKNAGYSLKDMIDKDISLHPEDYPNITKADPNIDFRRVRNLRIFFKKYAKSLTLDYNKIEEWQPGDIVIFRNNKHIGIISDRRSSKGVTYVIHHGSEGNKEENYLSKDEVTGHYRFDASLIPEEVLMPWHE